MFLRPLFLVNGGLRHSKGFLTGRRVCMVRNLSCRSASTNRIERETRTGSSQGEKRKAPHYREAKLILVSS